MMFGLFVRWKKTSSKVGKCQISFSSFLRLKETIDIKILNLQKISINILYFLAKNFHNSFYWSVFHPEESEVRGPGDGAQCLPPGASAPWPGWRQGPPVSDAQTQAGHLRHQPLQMWEGSSGQQEHSPRHSGGDWDRRETTFGNIFWRRVQTLRRSVDILWSKLREAVSGVCCNKSPQLQPTWSLKCGWLFPAV